MVGTPEDYLGDAKPIRQKPPKVEPETKGPDDAKAVKPDEAQTPEAPRRVDLRALAQGIQVDHLANRRKPPQ